MNWKISRTEAFVRQAAMLVKKDPPLRGVIAKAVDRLRTDPRHPGLRVRRVQSLPGQWEARVNDDIRIIFSTEQDEILLQTVCHHDDVLPQPSPRQKRR